MKQARYKHAVITLFKFAIPLIFSGILQQLYHWADAFVVGQVLGEQPLAAVGMTSSISNCAITMITGFTMGLSVIAAQRYGSGEKEAIKKTLSSFLLILTGVMCVVAVLLFVFSGQILTVMDTPENIIDYAHDYLTVILFGLPFLSVYNLYAGILRAMGDSKASFYAVIVSSVVNIVLDVCFVAIFRWGIKSAAWATVIAQIGMTIFLVLYAVKKYSSLRFSIKEKLLFKNEVTTGLRYALPLTIQSSVIAVGNMVLQSFMNGFGSQTVAAITTAYRVDSIMLLPIINLGAAISTMVAQSKGAGDSEKVKQYSAAGTGMGVIMSFILMAAMYFFGGPIISIFGISSEAIGIGSMFFKTISIYYIVFGLETAMRGITEGSGKVLVSSMIGIAGLVVRITLSYVLAASFGNMTIAHAEGIQWVFMMLCYAVFLFVKKGKDIPV